MNSRAALVVGSLLLLAILVRTAWLCDDAYITLRAVDHFVRGFGPNYNADERVQAFTHPLWMLLLTAGYAPLRDARAATFALTALCDVAAGWLLVRRIARSPAAGLFALVAWAFSKAAVDYSTSGLENPLSDLLLLAFLALGSDRGPGDSKRLLARACVAGLVLLNRLDLVFLVAPPLLAEFARSVRATGSLRRPLARVAVGMAPVAGWLAFALVYYGFLLPNTASAKLSTGIAPSLLWRHGADYLWQTVRFDPVTALVILAAIAAAAAGRGEGGERAARRAVALGLVLHLVYVASVGGDFMRGRFLVAPFFVACAELARSPWLERPRLAWTAAGVVAALGCAAGHPPITSGATYGLGLSADEVQLRGISDERAFYFHLTAPLRADPFPVASKDPPPELVRPRDEGEARVVLHGQIGFFGFEAGPRTHVIDFYGLADPLLARLPAFDPWEFRVGHYGRTIPDGYEESLRTGQNRLADPGLRDWYDALRLAVTGPLFTSARWRAIWQLNTRALADRIDPARYVRRAPRKRPPK